MNLTPQQQLTMLRTMQTIRRFEERASDEFQAGHIYGVVHCYIGQEAVAVGVCAALNREDQIISTHRGHGHCIAKGADLKRMMAELYGRATGYCKGKGGSMHIADFGIGMLGANGIVAGGIPIITGAGLAAQLDGKGRVAVSFFGDGAASAGPWSRKTRRRFARSKRRSNASAPCRFRFLTVHSWRAMCSPTASESSQGCERCYSRAGKTSDRRP
jgi:pyruvate dehydrogenase E1 component alpha subunit